MRKKSGLAWVAAVASGLLMAASFPPLEWSGAAWVSLVPLIVALSGLSVRRQILLGWLAGTVCWVSSINWLCHVTVGGLIGLSVYCGLYFGLFAMVTGWLLKRTAKGSVLENLALMFFIPALWTGFELVRSHLITGFPWNLLGVTQVWNILLIQHASWGGVYAISFAIVWVNTSLALTLMRYLDPARRRRGFHMELAAGLLLVVVLLVSGQRMLQEPAPASVALRTALIQTGIPQDDKWDREKIEMIYGRLWDLTRTALHAGKSDLIIWPETSLPDDVRSSESSYDLVYSLVTNGTPILAGSMDTEWLDEGDPRYFNSSFLFDVNGQILEVYDKRHLVLFGEYLPFGGKIPWINAFTPIEASFSSGTTSTVFHLENPNVAFSVLICFEDAVAGRRGSR
ncbi:MAG: apolipoprotein N-acyltransferase [Lentisphaerota bacterium]